MTRIAVVGMACQYPDARSPRDLWENALAGRRAFRRLPDERMRLEDYWDADPATPDRFYARNAAVIDGYEFDRIAYKIAGSTYRSTDLTHWLALDTAAKALADAGFPMAEGLSRQRTSVVVGNSLTGEFTRANQMRLRWPYVRRTLAGALREQGWDDDRLATFLAGFEATYKSPFPEIGEDSLAGALSNTIAGRICNYFDLKGGGYTVDGACSSSLLSVATACKALLDGEVDTAVAGGVDLSIDPFEIIGFAKTGALATSEMRVYDRASNGFWPGEGCGMVVLMREPEAVAAGHRIYASVAGWGISSDGKGGITRPEVSGYQLALRRAYGRSGFGIETVGLFEGHGTGTRVGDTTELTALSQARSAADPDAAPAAIGSIKGMIGHTKAAAGVAGLIKAAMAVHHEVLPPSVGCFEPHELLGGESSLRMLRKAEPWPSGGPVRAGITAMGFGGINAHVVLESPKPRRRVPFDSRTRALAASVQDMELLLVDADSDGELVERLHRLIDFVSGLSYAQLADLAFTLHRELRDRPVRAAVVVSSPDDAAERLRKVCEAVEAGETRMFSPDGRCLLGHVSGPRRIGFLFPGQGSGRGTSGGALRRRFAEAEEVYLRAALPTGGDVVATEVAQPRIVTGSMAGLRVLNTLGIEASVAVGHSLGEIAALHWAGSLDEDELLRIAAVRGRTMAEHSSSGTMASIAASPEVVEPLIAAVPVVVASYNGPTQTVVAGTADAVAAACDKARTAGLGTTPLPVSHAFHSPLVAPAADAFGAILREEHFAPVDRQIVSTITGDVLAPDTDVAALLHQQITDPVLFNQAVTLAAKDVDLFVEVGPGRVLSTLAEQSTNVPAVALDTDDESAAGLLGVVGAAYAIGAASVDAALFHGRLVRPLEVGAEFRFFESPCEQAPSVTLPQHTGPAGATPPAAPGQERAESGEPVVEQLRRMAAERAELPLDLVQPDSRLLDDLHLSSITVGQVVNQLTQQLNVPATQLPTNFAMATISELAEALDTLATTDGTEAAAGTDGGAAAAEVAGAAPWVRAWRIDLDVTDRPAPGAAGERGQWQVFAESDHPFAERLGAALDHARLGDGVLVCLPPQSSEAVLPSVLSAAKAALRGGPGTRFVLVQHDRGAAGLAKTLSLEAPQVRTTVIHTGTDVDVDVLVAEVSATERFAEVHLDADGSRRVPTLRALPVQADRTEAYLDTGDVLLVTGGGKGISAECALAMAVDSGAGLALLGRSDPAEDRELAANLERIAAAGVTVHYARADVTDPGQVRRAVDELTGALGGITAILHGAGRNEPAGITDLDTDAFRATFAPKVDGLRTVVDAVGGDQLKLLVTLGSIIGRSGLRGEAHYATANEWLADLTTEIGRRHPGCRSLCLEWSVWSGVGMGERLSVVEGLTRDGITPVTPDQGVAVLRRLLVDPATPPVVVISGRTEGIDTIRRDLPDLPLLRFLGRPLVRYHGVELVTEVELSVGTDVYLADHFLDDNLLFPAVFGMEAMAQVAAAVTGTDPDEPGAAVPVIEDIRFERPIVVPPHGRTTMRIAAVVTDDDTVTVAIRSSETAFAVDHFTARLGLHRGGAPDGPPAQAADGLAPVPLDPATDLYGGVMFQGKRFQRVRQYHRAAARDVDAAVAPVPGTDWFAGFVPDGLLLGDPGVRDALMHGNQVCVPDATLLPAGVDRIYPAGDRIAGDEPLRYCATERSRDGDTYVYDIALRDDEGTVVERWEGLRLRAVRKTDAGGPWVPALLGPYLERAFEDVAGARVSVVVEPDGPSPDAADGSDGERGEHVARRRERTRQAASRVFGPGVELAYRPDGRPEVPGGRTVSASHAAGLTYFVAGDGVIGCDAETVTHQPPDAWNRMLNGHAEVLPAIEEATGDNTDTAATRVWTAMECLHKAGLTTAQGPLMLRDTGRPGWVVFNAGDAVVATFVTTVCDGTDPVVFAVLAQGRR
ncbi:SDR family NAD(P)-dependent oxidoreductase [Dactylosporangium cerinum]|uniref:SDR family NAD(P)-dependent oxidoreductase n=1 Tax=Dactylosporangium cerinum TaxID=1434730 RepID=A0ABV9VS29_9ACTN